MEKTYFSYVGSVLLYGAEGWALTDRVQSMVTGCDCRILRYMAGVSLRDRVRSEEVARRCGVEMDRWLPMREWRLRRFGHVRRREEDDRLEVLVDDTGLKV